MNEVGASVSEFNINDYIWYIVGGVALFFVIVGFIADKSGLAKKTFSKEANNANKNTSNQQPVVPVVVPEVPVTTPVAPSSETMAVNPVSESSDFVAGTTPDTITEPVENNNEMVEATQPVASEDSGYSDVEQNVSENLVVQTEEDNVQNESANEESVWDVNSSDVTEADQEFLLDTEEESSSLNNEQMVEDNNLEVSQIATENAEDDWGMQTASDSVDVELPNLEDISSETEEDVWKF